MDGVRKSFYEEFTSIYCFNLRGNARTSGEQRRMEKGNVFGEGTRTPVAITILIRNPEKAGSCQLYYHDIGDYLDREQKLETIANFRSIASISWQKITPNDSHDWINQRDPAFESFIPIISKDDSSTSEHIFRLSSRGFETARDSWVYNFSQTSVHSNMFQMIDFYNNQVSEYQSLLTKPNVDQFINTDPSLISWTSELKKALEKQLILNPVL
jgi:predicted helicase